ncbi:hypothetical protein PVL29_004634 [Vitis rotundifolia]|uniref:Transposase MuDR plant domain-containing protein n=1 Tax=Vitis rotundifolia TaxID=103349 RepID=A0AA39A8N7_VITRO|nr:hypothetical protein PVL29_004634 [Vitis rotundifolia]
MSLIELNHIIAQLGYDDCIRYYHAYTNGKLVWCLIDQILLEMSSSFQLIKSVCESEGSKTNVTVTPNVDAIINEAKDTFGESEFVDDEHPLSDDDDLYDNYVNDNKEWGEKNLCDDDMRSLDNGIDTNMINPQFSVGLLFTSATKFGVAMREYAIKNGRNMKFIKNEKDKVVYATQVRDEKTFQVMTYNVEHTCGRVFKNYNITSRYLCNKFVDNFKHNPKLSIGAFLNTVKSSLAWLVPVIEELLPKSKHRH